MGQAGTGQVVERFKPTSGRVTGVLVLVVAAGIAVLGAMDRDLSRVVVALAVLAGVLAWATMLRPALWVTEDDLVMRNMVETTTIPLAGIEELALRQVLSVRAGDRRFVSPVVGRPMRSILLGSRGSAKAPDTPVQDVKYTDYVEDRLHRLVDDARASAGVRPGSPEQLALAGGVRREPAWLPIALISAAVVGVVVTFVA